MACPPPFTGEVAPEARWRARAVIAAIFGLSGPVLTDAERALFRAANPAGFILFARNCVDPGQLGALTASLRDLMGRDLPILIDQEGGRVSRLRPPHWPAFPAAARFGELYAKAPLSATQAAYQDGLALAAVLRGVGVNVDCVPVLDVPVAGAHDIIGDRAYATDPMWVAAMGGALLDGLHDGGVCGVVKHLPGHGRAGADSHLELPVVDAPREELAADFAPFRTLAGKARMGMTAHVVYTALDPEACASLSPTVIAGTIRGTIGFEGLLMSDDLGMKALSGPMGARAAGVVKAGCDLALYCWDSIAEMEEIAGALGPMAEVGVARLERAMAGLADVGVPDHDKAAAHRDALLAYA